MMDTGDAIAFWALIVAAAAFVVSSAVSAVAAWWSARSARAAEVSAEHAGDAISLVREQLALSAESTASAARSATAAEESTAAAARSAAAAEESTVLAGEALEGLRAQTEIARESADTARNARNWDDRPRFEMKPARGPEGERWWIDVVVVDGPTRVQARWLHQGQVHGPVEPVVGASYEAYDSTYILGELGGPAYLHRGATFRVAVECPANASGFDVSVSVIPVELDPDNEDRPTGRRWTDIQDVSAKRPRGGRAVVLR